MSQRMRFQNLLISGGFRISDWINLDFKVNFWILFESLVFVILKIQLKYTYEQSMNHSADQHLAINSPVSLGPINHSADLFQYCTQGTHTDNFRFTTFEWVLEVLLASPCSCEHYTTGKKLSQQIVTALGRQYNHEFGGRRGEGRNVSSFNLQ